GNWWEPQRTKNNRHGSHKKPPWELVGTTESRVVLGGSHSSHQSHQLAQYYARQKTHHKNPEIPYVALDARQFQCAKRVKQQNHTE
ncbi:TPA: hypothetical protein ACHJHJ_003712, partial [Escherichia coli]